MPSLEGTDAVETPNPLDRLTSAYRDAWSGLLVLPRPAPDVIVMGGATRVDFLQRMSTNDFSSLDPGQLRTTVLTTPLARIVDWVQVLAQPDRLLLLTTPGRGEAVLGWLRKHVFFRDDLTLQLDTTSRDSWLTLGAAAGAFVSSFVPGAEDMSMDTWQQAGEVLTWRVARPAAGGWAIVAPSPGPPGLSEHSLPGPLAEPLYSILRIEAGIPATESEITAERIPLEVGLSASISLDKGCYIGQEIIARMTSRDRLARRLVGVRLGVEAKPGEELRQQDSLVGQLTSVACSPRLGWIALALVRPTALRDEGSAVGVGASAESARLVELPFPGPSGW